MIVSDVSSYSLAAVESLLRSGEGEVLQLLDPRGGVAPLDEVLPLFDAFAPREVPPSVYDPSSDPAAQRWLPPPARPGRRYRVTAVVPSHRRPPLALGALREQDCEVEVLALANGAGADRVEGDRVLRVPWEGHARTRQRGVEAADGEYVLWIVDDAVPRGRGVVSTLVEALEDGGYDAVFGRQLPWPSTDPITRARLRRWTPPPAPGERHRLVERYDHVFALARRETLLRWPLPDVPIAEDLHWRQGRRIGYVAAAPAVHAHVRRPLALYRRNRDIHREHTKLGEPPRVPDLPSLLRALPAAGRAALSAGLPELPNQLAELLGQWRGGRAGQRPGGRAGQRPGGRG